MEREVREVKNMQKDMYENKNTITEKETHNEET
jgi:hypothetical protein